jgi:hypothetical protein
MMPRGEVALIVAGIGLSQRIIGEVVFGVSIMMTLITTILAPLLLAPAFARGGSGRKKTEDHSRTAKHDTGLPGTSALPAFRVTLNPGLSRPFLNRLLALAETRGWEPSYDDADEALFLLRNGDDAASVKVQDGVLTISATDVRQVELVDLANQVKAEMVSDAETISVASP